MNSNRIYRTHQQETQERGRAQLRVIQTRGLAKLQIQLQQQDKEMPGIVNTNGVWAIRRSLQARVGMQLQQGLDALKAMAQTAVPWIKRFYIDVLKKYIFTHENLELLGKVAAITYNGGKALLTWLSEMWKHHPGIFGAVTGIAVGAKSIAGVAAFLSAIPLIGSFLAGVATAIAIGGAACLGCRISTWLHAECFRNRQLAQSTDTNRLG
jgi:hypothetical protein